MVGIVALCLIVKILGEGWTASLVIESRAESTGGLLLHNSVFVTDGGVGRWVRLSLPISNTLL